MICRIRHFTMLRYYGYLVLRRVRIKWKNFWDMGPSYIPLGKQYVQQRCLGTRKVSHREKKSCILVSHEPPPSPLQLARPGRYMTHITMEYFSALTNYPFFPNFVMISSLCVGKYDDVLDSLDLPKHHSKAHEKGEL